MQVEFYIAVHILLRMPFNREVSGDLKELIFEPYKRYYSSSLLRRKYEGSTHLAIRS